MTVCRANNKHLFSPDKIPLLFLLKCFIAAFLISLYIDVFSLSVIGTIITYVLCCILVISVFINPMAGCKYFLILMLVIPMFPLNILDTFENLQVTKSLKYETITYSSIAGFAVYQILFMGIALFFLMRMKRIRSCSFVIIFLVGMFFPTLLHYWTEPETFMFREVITTLRYPLYLWIGWIIYCFFREREDESVIISMILEIFVCTSLILVFKAPFHLFNMENAQALSLGLNPQITLPLLLAFIILHGRTSIQYNILLCVILLFSLFSPARWDIIIMSFSFVLFIMITKKFAVSVCLGILALMALVGTFYFVQLYNSRLTDFFLWKLMDFSLTNKLSDSGSLRIFELRNIIAQNGYNPLYWLLGKGGSGYFTFQDYTPDFFHILDLKSYQYYELEKGIFYHPHMFINHFLLKFGLVGFFIYIYISYKIFFMSVKLFKQRTLLENNELCFVVIALFFSVTFFLASAFNAVYSLLSIFFFMLLKDLNEKYLKHKV